MTALPPRRRHRRRRLSEVGFGAAGLGNLYRATATTRPPAAVDARGTAASATSTPRRTTGSGCRSAASAPRCASCPATSSCCRPRSAGCSCRTRTRPGRTARASRCPTTSSAGGTSVRTASALAGVQPRPARRRPRSTSSTPTTPTSARRRRSPGGRGGARRAASAQGVIRAIGVGTNYVDGIAELFADRLLDVVMLAGRYTLLEQGALDSVLEPARAARASVVAVAVFNSGLLADRTSRAPTPSTTTRDAPSDLLAARESHRGRLRGARGHASPGGHRLPAAAPGRRGCDARHARRRPGRQNLDRYAAPIPAQLWSDLVGAGLLDARSIGAAETLPESVSETLPADPHAPRSTP